MSLNDLLFIAITLWVILISTMILVNIKDKERGKDKMDAVSKARKDMIDLEKITKNIEADYKPLNIDLTNYELEQENNAIISYDELIKSKDRLSVNYDETFKPLDGIDVKKVDLSASAPNNPGEAEKIALPLISYEKEEAFLKALKQLQMDLAR